MKKAGEKMTLDEVVSYIEDFGEELQGKPVEMELETKSERVTIRLTADELSRLDKMCGEMGIGRSAYIRLVLRNALGMSSFEVKRKPLQRVPVFKPSRFKSETS